MILSTFGRSFFALVLLAIAVSQTPTSGSTPEEIDFAIPAEHLPFELHCYDQARALNGGTSYALDTDGDGHCCYFRTYSRSGDNCLHYSAVGQFRDPLQADAIDEYHGPLSTCQIWSSALLRDESDSSARMVLTKSQGDTIWLELVEYTEKSQIGEPEIIKAAVREDSSIDLPWGVIHVDALGDEDLNGDGSNELIYSRTAKPESAFTRAVIAYDRKSKSPLWLYPTADIVKSNNFHRCTLPNGETIFVMVTISCANPYRSANGMDSQHAYVFALDQRGNEMWRQEIGSAFFYPASLLIDIDGDGSDELIVTREGKSEAGHSTFAVESLEPASGDLENRSVLISMSGIVLSADTLNIKGEHNQSLILSGIADGNPVIYRLNSRLEIVNSCAGGNLLGLVQIETGNRPYMLVTSTDLVYALLSPDFEIMGKADGKTPLVGDDSTWQGATTVQNPDGGNYFLVSAARRSPLSVFFQKYKWTISLISVALLLVALFGGRVLRIYSAMQGLPSVNTVSSAVIVTNRRGRIVFHNQHPLIAPLLGEKHRRWQSLGETPMCAVSGIKSFFQSASSDHFSLYQEQFELRNGGSPIRIWISAYPRLDQSQNYRGKIILIENLGEQANFRRVFLGEAIQRIVHNMKTQLNTISYGLENYVESAESPCLPECSGNTKRLDSIIDQAKQVAGVCESILHYASLGKPDLQPEDLNLVIEIATDRLVDRLRTESRQILVLKELQSGLPKLVFDASQISDVLHNLLSNAVKAVGVNGTITIRSRLARVLPAKLHEGAVEFEVSDTGTGITKEDLGRIFDPGFSRFSSTGVGLALVREIVSNHAGAVSVDSVIGEGTTFTVRLPFGGGIK